MPNGRRLDRWEVRDDPASALLTGVLGQVLGEVYARNRTDALQAARQRYGPHVVVGRLPSRASQHPTLTPSAPTRSGSTR